MVARYRTKSRSGVAGRKNGWRPLGDSNNRYKLLIYKVIFFYQIVMWAFGGTIHSPQISSSIPPIVFTQVNSNFFVYTISAFNIHNNRPS